MGDVSLVCLSIAPAYNAQAGSNSAARAGHMRLSAFRSLTNPQIRPAQVSLHRIIDRSRPSNRYSIPHNRQLSTSIQLSAPPPSSLVSLPVLSTDARHLLARQWIDGFGEGDIPKDALEVTYARSSGPGGQHVNKTNSKAVVRCSMGSWLPPFVQAPLRSSPHYLPNPPSLLITSQLSRSAPQNQAAAMAILHQTIVSAARSIIRGATSAEQKRKVEGLVRREESRRRESKDRLKSKKASRRE